MLKNKVIVVVGACGLLGKTLCKSILKNEGTIVLADINIDNLKSLYDSLKNKSGKSCLSYCELDINSATSLDYCLKNTLKKWGKIDGLINSAYPKNSNYGKSFFEVQYEDFCENLSINLGGSFLTSQKFLEFFIDQGYGNIINISSIYGVIAPKFEIYKGTNMTVPVEYVAIKSALIHLTKYMAKLVKGKSIRVNCISPGGLLNGQAKEFLKKYNSQCLEKGMLDAEDLNGVVLFLLSEMSRYISGQNIIIDDGFVL
ncbi:MAG: flagellin modification protein A [Candidatus Cloacimonadota bacterium]|nr:MAG: flagellin modification protein A [Candidatus Cloacimonadota bacterium]